MRWKKKKKATGSIPYDKFVLDRLIFRFSKHEDTYVEVNVIEYVNDGYFVAEVDQCGIVTQAGTFDDLLFNIKEAVTLYYE